MTPFSIDDLTARVSCWLESLDSPLSADLERRTIEIIDQRDLPYRRSKRFLDGFDAAFDAIATMQVRGAPLIGLCGAFGIAMAMDRDPSDASLKRAVETMRLARPTAVNLAYAVDWLHAELLDEAPTRRADLAWRIAKTLELADRNQTMAIGRSGFALIDAIAKRAGGIGRPVSILTHCNAGRLATAGVGTALAPLYFARQAGIEVEVFIDETRPRNQGMLTAFELSDAGVFHRVIVDNAGGHLMQQKKIDLVLVGADRVTRAGDVANKIGTYLKALAAYDNQVPFYAAFPLSTVDWTLTDGVKDIPIETRDGDEVRQIAGLDERGGLSHLSLLGGETPVENPGFDVTPARLLTGLITERGVCAPGDLSKWSPSPDSL